MNFAFFGTDKFSTIILDELKQAGFIPKFILTAPDKPQGRKLVLTPPPVKIWAQKNNISYVQPEKLSKKLFTNTDWDLFVVASFGKIIPQEVLDIPKHKTLNVHPSLLPKLRGASPIQSAILEEKETGVSIMRIDEKMDHGPIVDQRLTTSWTTATTPNAIELEELLAHEGGKLLAESISGWISGEIAEQGQDHQSATYTEKIKKQDGLINLSDEPELNFRKIQAFKKWPKSYFFIKHKGKEKRIIITDAQFVDSKLKILKVLPEGSKEMNFDDFKKGYPDLPL